MSTVKFRCGARDRLIEIALLRAAIAGRHENSILFPASCWCAPACAAALVQSKGKVSAQRTRRTRRGRREGNCARSAPLSRRVLRETSASSALRPFLVCGGEAGEEL